jgi:hypothetical protein
MVTPKCVICDKRPARTDKGWCLQCAENIKAQNKRRQPDKPERYITYRGHVVGLFKNGGGTLQARLVHIKPERLPKTRTLDLNTYLDGFSRDQIKKMKRTVLALAGA